MDWFDLLASKDISLPLRSGVRQPSSVNTAICRGRCAASPLSRHSGPWGPAHGAVSEAPRSHSAGPPAAPSCSRRRGWSPLSAAPAAASEWDRPPPQPGWHLLALWVGCFLLSSAQLARDLQGFSGSSVLGLPGIGLCQILRAESGPLALEPGGSVA